MRTQTRTRLTSVFPTSDDVFQPLLYFIYYLFPSTLLHSLPFACVLRLSYLETSPLASRSGHMTEDELSRLQRPKSASIRTRCTLRKSTFHSRVCLWIPFGKMSMKAVSTSPPLRDLSTLLIILLTSLRSQIVKCRYPPPTLIDPGVSDLKALFSCHFWRFAGSSWSTWTSGTTS